MRRFGVLSVVLLTGCLYSLSGGGGLPRHIRTVAVIPFENETANPEVAGELHRVLRKTLGDRLGLREAPETRASAIVTGTIRKHEPGVAVGFSAAPALATTARRRGPVVVAVKTGDQTPGPALIVVAGLQADG